MHKVKDILLFLEQYAPYELAESWDNCGLLVGDENEKVTKVLCALDATQDVLNEAINTNCNLIIAHHPVIFTSIKNVTTKSQTGKIITKAIKNNVSIICMHTNLDATTGGVNDALAEKMELKDIYKDEKQPFGRIGILEKEKTLNEFLDIVKDKLNANGIKFVGEKNVKKVAVLGGAGGKLMDFAINNNCDTYITSDCSYDIFWKAKSLGINLIDAGHFATENAICEKISTQINDKFGEISKVADKNQDIINFR